MIKINQKRIIFLILLVFSLTMAISSVNAEGENITVGDGRFFKDQVEEAPENSVVQVSDLDVGSSRGNISITKNVTIQSMYPTRNAIINLNGNNNGPLFSIQEGGNLTLINLTIAFGIDKYGYSTIENHGTLNLINCEFKDNQPEMDVIVIQGYKKRDVPLDYDYQAWAGPLEQLESLYGVPDSVNAVLNVIKDIEIFGIISLDLIDKVAGVATGLLGLVFGWDEGDEKYDYERHDYHVLIYKEKAMGGAIHNTGTLFAENCIFTRNSGIMGGAIRNNGSKANATLINCIFDSNGPHPEIDFEYQNKDGVMGGAIYNGGGATITINDSSFINNVASYSGGAIYNDIDSTLNLNNCNFKNNTVFQNTITDIPVLPDEFLLLMEEYVKNHNYTHNPMQTGMWNSLVLVNTTNFSNFTRDSNISDLINKFAEINLGFYEGLIMEKMYIPDFIEYVSTNFLIHMIDEGIIVTDQPNYISVSTEGGAITNRGIAIFNDCDFTNNSAGTSLRSTSSDNCYGGVIVNQGNSANLTINNCTFTDNKNTDSGGVVYNLEGANLTINNSTFLDNNVQEFGGAIYNLATITLNNCTFTHNSASISGGAIYNGRYGILTVNNCYFLINVANGVYGTIAGGTGRGGAIYNTIGLVFVNNSIFDTNTARYDGGAIYNNVNSSFSVNNSSFKSNRVSNNGGAIYNQGNNTVINNSIFSKNVISGNGSAIYNEGNNLSIINSNFTNNSANIGGAIYNIGNNSSMNSSNFISNSANIGGAIYNEEDDLSIIGSNFINNSANSGGAINNYGNNVNIIDSNFINNSAETGGAINNNYTIPVVNGSAFGNWKVTINFGGNNLSIKNSNFTNNSAISGGAIYNYANNLSISESIFINNSAETGGVIYNNGNNISIYYSIQDNDYIIGGNNISINGSNFTNNSAATGGAIYNYGGNNFNINSSSFITNIANDGGAVYNNGNNISMGRYFTRPLGAMGGTTLVYSPEGGGIYKGGDNFSITDSNFIDNSADIGGTIHNTGRNLSINGSDFINNSAITGGAIYNNETNLSVRGSNFINNTGDTGGAIYNTKTGFVANYNRFVNNTDVVYDGSAVGDLNYNWWGSNTPPSGLNFNKYFVVNVVNLSYMADDGITEFDYTIDLNDESSFDISEFPDFLGFVNIDLLPHSDFNPKENQTLVVGDSTLGYIIHYEFIIDNEIFSFILFNPLKDVYVNLTGGDDSNIANNWTNAIVSINLALEIVKTNGTIHITGDSDNHYTGINNTNLTINRSVTIVGELGEVIIDGENKYIIFNITGDNVTIENLKFINGFSKDFGGTIYIEGNNISIINSSFVNSSAIHGGAVYNDGNNNSIIYSNFINSSANIGGAIYNNRGLILKNNNMEDCFVFIEGNYIYNNGTIDSIVLTYLKNQTIEIGRGISTKLDVTITDDNGNPITGGDVTLVFDSTTLSFYVSEGLVEHTTSFDDLGTYLISGDYSSSKMDNVVAIKTGEISVVKKDTNIEIDNIISTIGETSKLSIILTDVDGNKLYGQDIMFYLEGKHIGSNKTDVNGLAVFNYKSDSVGIFRWFALFNGDEDYNVVISDITNLTINKLETKVIITSFNIDSKKRIRLKVTLTDANGKSLDNKEVSITINNKKYKATTNSKGVASFIIPKLKEGKHKINSIFNGDNIYQRSSILNTKSVKFRADLTIKAKRIKYAHNKKLAVYKLTIYNKGSVKSKATTLNHWHIRKGIKTKTMSIKIKPIKAGKKLTLVIKYYPDSHRHKYCKKEIFVINSKKTVKELNYKNNKLILG